MKISIYNAAQKYKTEILSKIDKSNDPNICWGWTGTKTEKGYGRYSIYPSTAFYAHRIVYVLFGNTIPKGRVLDHICKNRGCVNPNHLNIVSITQNTLENSNSLPAKNSSKTHCIQGHPFKGSNLIISSSQRRCRTCDRNRETKRIRIIKGKVYPVSVRASGKDAESFFETI